MYGTISELAYAIGRRVQGSKGQVSNNGESNGQENGK